MASNPAKIGKYKIQALIGKGGMGAVYKAAHPTLDRSVIIKKLTTMGQRDFEERFKREARIMMDFRNENIVQVYDHFKEGGAYYIVMEFVDGITLEDLIKEKRFIPDQMAMLIFNEICKALKYAHDQSVIHRDIKPANILISNTGIVKLVDFGVSTSLEETDDDSLTKAGMTIGTPSYLAPEQISNAKNRDKRADIYSMGVMFYEMVVGKKPFKGGFTPEVICLIEKGKYIAPRKVNPKIKPLIQKIIKKAMHHKVKRRFQDLGFIIAKLSRPLKKINSQDEINQRIKKYLEGKEEQETKYKKKKVVRFSSNFSKIFSITALVIVIAGLSAGWAWKQGLHYEYYLNKEYGVLQIKAKLRKGYKKSSQNFLKAMLYQEKNNQLVQIKNIDLKLELNKKENNKVFFHYISPKIYLKQSPYTVLLYIENEQYRENFQLYPRIRQKLKLSSAASRIVSFEVGEISPALPVKFNFQVFDIHSGLSINKKEVVLSIQQKGHWMSWQEFIRYGSPNKILLSGKKYKLRFKKKGYFKKYYSVTIRPEQTTMTLKVQMTPIPGKLRVKTKHPNLKILLNNSAYYISGKKARLWKKVPDISAQYQSIFLSPGEYFITAESNDFFGSKKPQTKKVIIKSGKKVSVLIAEKGQNSVQINIK